MLSYFDKNCVEFVLRESHAESLAKFLRRRNLNLRPIAVTALDAVLGEKASVVQQTERIKGWFRAEGGTFVLDVVVPPQGSAFLIVVAMSKIERLSTDWGKKHHSSKNAYLTI